MRGAELRAPVLDHQLGLSGPDLRPGCTLHERDCALVKGPESCGQGTDAFFVTDAFFRKSSKFTPTPYMHVHLDDDPKR